MALALGDVNLCGGTSDKIRGRAVSFGIYLKKSMFNLGCDILK